MGPVPAIQSVLANSAAANGGTALTLGDIGRVEVNEAFAVRTSPSSSSNTLTINTLIITITITIYAANALVIALLHDYQHHYHEPSFYLSLLFAKENVNCLFLLQACTYTITKAQTRTHPTPEHTRSNAPTRCVSAGTVFGRGKRHRTRP